MRNLLIMAVVFALVGVAGIAIAQIDGGETIYACAKSNNGNLRIVEGPDDCLNSEYPLAWNQMGPPGPQGVAGPQGPAGPEGPPGSSVHIGQVCPEGEHVRGFEDDGSIVCSALPAPPVITLLGPNPMTLEAVVDQFADPGVTITDDHDDPATLLAVLLVSGAVDSATPGSYAVTYSVTDSHGLQAQAVTRVVNVVDTTPPAITLHGANPMILEQFDVFIDPGAHAEDLVDGFAAVSATGAVNTSTPGAYRRYYTAQDGSGNAATVERGVIVEAPPCDPDAHEPNESAPEAWELGDVSSDSPLTIDGTICLADHDYYLVDVREVGQACFPGTAQHLRIDVDLIGDPNGDDIDLVLYDWPWMELASSTTSHTTEHLRYDWDGICGVDDQRRFGIRVVGYPHNQAISDYTLTLTVTES